MIPKTPKPLSHYWANFTGGLTTLSFSSLILLTPDLEADVTPKLMPLILTLIFGFLGYKASEWLIEKINKRNFRNLYKKILIWSLPLFYLSLFTFLNTLRVMFF